jgi:NodT family efflux transporter outer membrane factor (OMF) lipoprotein
MSKHTRFESHLGRLPCRAVLLLTVVSVSACAAIPDLGPAPEAKRVDVYSAENSFVAPAAEWPTEEWWTAYDDEQLSRLIVEALAGSPTLAEAEARVLDAEGFAQQAGAALLPQIGGEASVSEVRQSYNTGAPKAAIPKGWNDFGSASLNFSYEFDFWGKNRAALAAAVSSAEAARADRAQAHLTLATAVASAYAELAQLHADRNASADAVVVRTRTAELLSERNARGLENQGAVKEAEAGRAAAEARLAAIEEGISLTKNRLAALLGAGPDRGLQIAEPKTAGLKPFGLPANLRADLIGRRPDIAAARLRSQAAAERIKVAKADFYPNIDLTAVIGLQSLGIGSLMRAGSVFGAVGPAISLPIFKGGQLEGAYRGARAEYDAAVASYDAAVTQALNDVADVAASERALGSRLSKSREALASAEDAYRIVQNRYMGGLSAYLEVLTAEDSLIASRQSVADLETRAFALDVALVRALGGGFKS